MSVRRAIIFDIDGTLADCSHRQVHLLKEPKDWPAFNATMAMDTCNDWCRDLLEAMSWTHSIFLVTGREECFREETEAWLKNNGISHNGLFMRAVKDYRQDPVIKRELYEQFIKPTHAVDFIVEDRARVVKMWREIGLVCLQCAEGNF